MWKRDEAVRPPSGQPTAAPQPPAPVTAGAPGPRVETAHQMEKDVVNIGKSVVIKGELNGSEDLTIEGHVEGTIQLRDHVLTIGPNGRIKAQVFAKAVIVRKAWFRAKTYADARLIRRASSSGVLGVSERWACRVVGQPRSTQRSPTPTPGPEEERLRTRLRELARDHQRYGYRTMTSILRREGFVVNHKRVQRLCRDEGLRVEESLLDELYVARQVAQHL